jgi:hypothetical protein
MTRKLKALGLVFVAVLALGALSATAASAASFHYEQTHTMITGGQPHGEDDIWTVNAGTVKCQSSYYTGTTSSATTETFTVTPEYGLCSAFGFINVPIDVNGCTYTFNVSGFFNISCLSGEITVTAFNCHVKIGTQTFLGGSYDNSGSGKSRDVTATLKLSGLKYTQESKSFPGCTKGSFINGTFSSSATFVGTNTFGEQIGIWKS